MKKLLVFLLLSVGALAQAPVWFKVAAGGDTITANKGTTLRYGMTASTYVFEYAGHKAGDPSPEGWSPAVTTKADGAFVADENFFGGDPLVDVYKEVDVQETTAPQTVVYTAQGSTTPVTVTVPALRPVNKPGAIISTGEWQGEGLPCWRKKVTAKNPDGTPGKDYWLEICGPIN